jgi:hypothetical protein
MPCFKAWDKYVHVRMSFWVPCITYKFMYVGKKRAYEHMAFMVETICRSHFTYEGAYTGCKLQGTHGT